jgi:hypothetical protein
MRYLLPLLLSFAGLLNGAVVLDRVAVIVGRRVVKASDVDRDLRVSHFLNRQPLDLSADAKRKAADRLIDQEIIRQELLNGASGTATEQDANAYLQQLIRDRFSGSEAQLRAALEKYGLSEEGLRQQLLWQLTVLRFIDERFRPGVLVTDEDVAAYYQQHRAEFPANSNLEALEPKIREILTGERVNQVFEEWLSQMRKNMRIEYRVAALSGGVSQ